MPICRDITKCVPEVQAIDKKFLALCKENNFEVMRVETFRSDEVQSAYYCQGRADLKTVNDKRKKAGLYLITESENEIITNTKPGYSKHNLGNAVDYVPLVNGKPCWTDSKLFARMGVYAKQAGYKWGGDFKSIKDSPHCEI